MRLLSCGKFDAIGVYIVCVCVCVCLLCVCVKEREIQRDIVSCCHAQKVRDRAKKKKNLKVKETFNF
jgi:hypothetical protein